MRLSIIGTGYVGLVTGTCLADFGHQVTCVDVDEQKLALLSQKILSIYEAKLDVLLSKNVDEKRLHFSTDLKKVVGQSEVIFLALPTPKQADGSSDLSYLMQVIEEIGPSLRRSHTLIINKSTVPVGTTKHMAKVLQKHTKMSFDVVSNPEFLREGLAVDDFMKPERIVIGTQNDKVKLQIEHLYRPLTKQGVSILYMDETSAELTKYASNAFLATKITFMNDMANLCEKVGANIDHVRTGMGADHRIGPEFLHAGVGYGGSCFPKDMSALYHSTKTAQVPSALLHAVMESNKQHRVRLFYKAKAHFSELNSKTFALWGLSFKPDTDDLREASSIDTIHLLLGAGAQLRVHDPKALPRMKKLFSDKLSYFSDPYECLKGADALFLLTEWSTYCTPDFDTMAKQLKQKVIFDGRNVFLPEQMKKLGFIYYSVGRGHSSGAT